MPFKKVSVTYVVVTLQVEGLHYWKDASIKAPHVSFLSNLHRHVFHIKATAKVDHNDRDIEIITLKRGIEEYLKGKYLNGEGPELNFEGMSCEMIALDLCEAFDLRSAEVTEDKENGALVEIQNHYTNE